MFTRATIAVRRNAGDYLATYLHFDSYREHAGQLLEANYLMVEEAESLMARNNIRCLDSEIGEAEYYDEETSAAVLPTLESLIDFARNLSAQHLCVFDNGE